VNVKGRAQREWGKEEMQREGLYVGDEHMFLG
jgi:hypothetical protein